MKFIFLYIGLLKKDPNLRPNIKDLLEDPWIQKFNKSNLPLLRQKSRDLQQCDFKIYSSSEVTPRK